MNRESSETRLLRRAEGGDRDAMGEIFALHRTRLRRMVDLRLDRRLRDRVDASDVIQEASLEAWRRLPKFLEKRDMPLFLWLRFLTGQKILELHRHHVGAQKRDARREVRLHRRPLPGASSEALAHQLMGRRTAPSLAARRAEARILLQQALDGMDPADREILSLRHFEQLSNGEAAAELGLDESAASKRYTRALRKLRRILDVVPGMREGPE